MAERLGVTIRTVDRRRAAGLLRSMRRSDGTILVDMDAVDTDAVDMDAVDMDAVDMDAVDMDAVDMDAVDMDARDERIRGLEELVEALRAQVALERERYMMIYTDALAGRILPPPPPRRPWWRRVADMVGRRRR